MKLWGGRFTKETAREVEEFTQSIEVDQLLAQYDIEGSVAHAKMLAHCGLLAQHELAAILSGLQKIQQKIADGSITYAIADEDIHMNLERLLQQEIGEVAGKLHTGRSRNDQIAVDLHLYCRDQILLVVQGLISLQQSLIEKAKLHIHTIMPGYTHLQQAQPVSFAHHLLAYVAMLQRDLERFIFLWNEVNTMPLGAGALAGTCLPIDRQFTAQLLNFDAVYMNSMDAVSNRDFIIVFLSHVSLIMMHLSRFSEELILWASNEFAFIEIDDAFCTGSSMMPQKKNPDVAELIRGKTARVYGALMSLLSLMKGLPLTYNRDMQEDKEALFDAVNTLHRVLNILPALINTLKVNKDRMLDATHKSYLCATALSDYLVMKDLPFRKTHEILGRLIKYCIENKLLLTQLSLANFQQFSPLFAEDIFLFIDPVHILATKKDCGGSGFDSVQHQLHQAEKSRVDSLQWLKNKIEIVKKQEKDTFSCLDSIIF